jgi:uncharacterized phiE125 gp8 family phage protein
MLRQPYAKSPSQCWQINRVAVHAGPAGLPVTLQELKDHLRITVSTEDTYLTRLLTVATAAVEQYLHRKFINQTLDLWLDFVSEYRDGIASMAPGFPSEVARAIELPFAPFSSITHVKAYDLNDAATTLAYDTDYATDSTKDDFSLCRVLLKYGRTWPCPLRSYLAVNVRYVVGYGAAAANIPEDVKQAVLVVAGLNYVQRGDCPQPTIGIKLEDALAAFEYLRILTL